MSCGVSRRCGLDPAWLWLWCRPAAAALIQPVAWELPHAVSEALKTKNKKQQLTEGTQFVFGLSSFPKNSYVIWVKSSFSNLEVERKTHFLDWLAAEACDGLVE